MSRIFTKAIVISGFLLFSILLLLLPRLASSASTTESFLPTPVEPEPYPFSDRYPAVIYVDSKSTLQTLYRLNIDIGGMQVVDEGIIPALSGFTPAIVTLYVSPEEAAQLAQLGLDTVPIQNEGLRSFYAYGPDSDYPTPWPTFEEFVARMQGLADTYPDLVTMHSIGTSTLGRDIWCLKISDQVALDEDEPEFKYSSTIHGDETTGIELTIRLAELLIQNYGTDPDLTMLVDEIEIWLCPISNPDGYVAGSRYNANGVDLNRNFPDRFTDPVDDPAGHELETQVLMNFGYQHHFAMGANYHGGELVFNYPWDAVAAPDEEIIPAYAPDDAIFHDFGLGYTSLNPMIYYGDFEEGLTPGWEWYQIWGGMQDWAYWWHGEHHVTIEVSVVKTPKYDEIDEYWENNRDAMLWWMERSLSGVRGRVLDARSGAPLDATLMISGMETPNLIQTDPAVGDYHRLIAPGSYTLTAAASGYQDLTHQVDVQGELATRQDFLLCPTTGWKVSGSVTQAVTGLPLEAVLEFLPSPQVVTSSRVDGQYSLAVCPGEYTLRASAPYHFPQERQVIVNQDLIENFVLELSELPPDLSGSTKLASISEALPGDVLDYEVVISNDGAVTTVTLTDTMPLSLTWTGELSASLGEPTFTDGQILWEEQLGPGEVVTITYSASITQCLSAGWEIENLAVMQDVQGVNVERSALVTIINQAPESPEMLAPANGAIDLPLEATLSWSASSDLNCDDLTYSVYFGTSNPPPLAAQGLTSTVYVPTGMTGHTTYYWSISASDGLAQSFSPTWQFTTLNRAPEAPYPVYPPDGSVDLPTSLMLSWASSDPDHDTLVYSLAFWEEGSPPVVINGLTSPQFNPGWLNPETKYYWQVTVSDGLDSIEGETWSFTTGWLRLYLPLALNTNNQEP